MQFVSVKVNAGCTDTTLTKYRQFSSELHLDNVQILYEVLSHSSFFI